MGYTLFDGVSVGGLHRVPKNTDEIIGWDDDGKNSSAL